MPETICRDNFCIYWAMAADQFGCQKNVHESCIFYNYKWSYEIKLCGFRYSSAARTFGMKPNEGKVFQNSQPYVKSSGYDTMEGYTEEEAGRILRNLDRKTNEELENLFRKGDIPTYDDVEGETLGMFIGWNRDNPWMVNFLVKLLFDSPVGRWTGKEFTESFDSKKRGKGINLFDNYLFPKRFPFDTYITPAELDGEPSMSLDYRPYFSLMSRLVDYVRLIKPGVVLGRMHYRFPFKEDMSFLGYFSLCKHVKND